jgi:predicted transcriptional regulator
MPKKRKSRKNQLAPIDIMLYNRIKNFTEKGELKCCCESSVALSKKINRHRSNISRSIKKLSRLGFIKIEKDDYRKLISTNKKMDLNYYSSQCASEIDKSATNCCKSATIIDKLAQKYDKSATNKLIKVLQKCDKSATHNIHINIHFLINILKEKEMKNLSFIENDKWKDLFFKWIDYRKKIKPLKLISYKAQYDKLMKLSGGVFEIASEIIGNSIADGWTGLFPLKENKKKSTRSEKNKDIINNCNLRE